MPLLLLANHCRRDQVFLKKQEHLSESPGQKLSQSQWRERHLLLQRQGIFSGDKGPLFIIRSLLPVHQETQLRQRQTWSVNDPLKLKDIPLQQTLGQEKTFHRAGTHRVSSQRQVLSTFRVLWSTEGLWKVYEERGRINCILVFPLLWTHLIQRNHLPAWS